VSKPGEGDVPTIRAWTIPACVGCIYDAVCRYFPKESAAIGAGFKCQPGYPGERVTRLSRTLVSVGGQLGQTRLILFEPHGAHHAAGVSCLGLKSICKAALKDWRTKAR